MEESDAFAARPANAWIHNAFRCSALKLLAQCLRLIVVVGIKGSSKARLVATQIVKTTIDIEHDFPELRRPPCRLLRPGHEARVMVNRLEQCGLEFPASVEDAKAAPA